MSQTSRWTRRTLLLAAITPALLTTPAQAATALLNVSYDVSREFYKDYNAAFAAHWKKTSGEDLVLNQSHGGSSRRRHICFLHLLARYELFDGDRHQHTIHRRGVLWSPQ